MKSFLLVVLGLVLGAVATILLATPVLTGVGAGVGVATGLKAGACLTVEAAKERGYITAEQVDELLSAGIQQIASAEVGDETAFGNDADCAKVVADLRRAAEK